MHQKTTPLNSFLKKTFRLLSGHHSEFSLENRMFNIISIIAFFAVAIALPTNYLLGYPATILLATVSLMLIQLYLYYLSRLKKRFHVSRIIFAILSYLFLSLNFFYNSGIDGPSLFAFFLTYLFLVAIFPRKTYWLWTLLHFMVVAALIYVNYYYPESVPNSYASNTSRSIDIMITYLIMLLFSYGTLNFIKANYDYEKTSASNKAIAIEKHNTELEKVNEEKNKLFSIVSHDLRSPLNTIQSYLELLSHGVLDDKEKKEAEKELLTLTKNTSDLLSNLLSWSKTQMEGVHAKLHEHNIFTILASTVNTQHAIASKKDISFNNKIDKQATATCDEDMLQLVVRNLLNNAIKFTPPMGEISIETSREGNQTWIIITDNGRGIPAEQQKEIFSLKIRSTYGTQNEKGIGLGLVLCKEYIEMQRGNIWFDSEPGKGTSFCISLPA